MRGYLPAPLSDEELMRIVDESIEEVNAKSMKDMGAVIGRATRRAGNRADGRRLSQITRDKLQG